jgi:hypothetical protein
MAIHDISNIHGTGQKVQANMDKSMAVATLVFILKAGFITLI